MNFMSQILYINNLFDWSLSGTMTSKLVIPEFESPRHACSILISRMTSSSVIIQYIMAGEVPLLDYVTPIFYQTDLQ